MNNKAFTLIELLVVISITALLISILLPALSKARESSQRIACMSGVKQMCVSSVAYTSDYDSHFPRTFHSGSEFPFAVSIGAPGGVKYGGLGLLYGGGYLNKSKSIFFCPGLSAGDFLSYANFGDIVDKAGATACYTSYAYRCEAWDMDENGILETSEVPSSGQYNGMQLSLLLKSKALIVDYFLHNSQERSGHINPNGTGTYNVGYTDGSVRPYVDRDGSIAFAASGIGFSGGGHGNYSGSHVWGWVKFFDEN
ncbi:MAG TPA: hypothetical protein DCM28_03290 [Phycisphaerales bacterium]|nr:hypothetical protein [Phycisphaerales bacterium]HCD31335.1 hypothetical protein [Phycisphaerales bacterium]|tara:strand:- start:1752 stop:2513 length:762 start_codon:yes stop_codon:yes gene_type:complete